MFFCFSIYVSIFQSFISLQAMHATKDGEMKLLTPVDSNSNTIAHLAVERGQVSVFKVMIVFIIIDNNYDYN